MANTRADRSYNEEVEAALLDVELFLKYRSPRRAVARLQSALKLYEHSIPLREKLREVAAAGNQAEEAARQCLALAGLYSEREDFETAHERLLEAKRLDPRLNIAAGLAAVRRARRPDLRPPAPAAGPRRFVTFAGDLSVVSVFDAVQVIENARLTGALVIAGGTGQSSVYFNEGRIVGAESAGELAHAALRRVLETTGGGFEFERSPRPYPVSIEAASNTNLLLDTLRELDEQKQ